MGEVNYPEKISLENEAGCLLFGHERDSGGPEFLGGRPFNIRKGTETSLNALEQRTGISWATGL